MKRIIVTGNAGSIGTRLVEALLGKGYHVMGYDQKESNPPHKMCKTWIGDFTFKDNAMTIFDLASPDVCYHLGAVTDVNWARLHPLETMQINVVGTMNVAYACMTHGVLLNYVSSCAVYGKTPEHPSREDSLKCPAEIYGCTKHAAERVIEGFASVSDLRYNIARPSTGIGEGMRKVLAPYIFLEKAWKGERISIHGSGLQTRPFVYLGDIVDGLVRLADVNCNEAFNFGGDKDVSVLELAHKCLGLFGKDAAENIDFIEDRPGQVMDEVIDSSKAKRVLGWTPKVSVDEALQKTAEWICDLK